MGEKEMGEEETEGGRGEGRERWGERQGEEETRGGGDKGRRRQLIDCSHEKHIAVLSSSLSSTHHRHHHSSTTQTHNSCPCLKNFTNKHLR